MASLFFITFARIQYRMNFLSHYYIDQHQESRYVVGTLTPDLLSIYYPSLRIKSGQVDHFDIGNHPEVSPVFFAGLQKHFTVDRIFHSSKIFTQETEHISRMLESYFPGREIHRKFFIAHILLELQLDQVLIRKDPGIVDRFYSHFEALRPFQELRVGTETVSGHPLTNYEQFLEKFTENRYLRHYREHDHIIYVLGRLLRRVKIADLAFLGERAFQDLMDAYHERLDARYMDFFEEIRSHEPRH
jgi:acyl carrier protein phosphodiesterase